jgi:hypothetical protein
MQWRFGHGSAALTVAFRHAFAVRMKRRDSGGQVFGRLHRRHRCFAPVWGYLLP